MIRTKILIAAFLVAGFSINCSQEGRGDLYGTNEEQDASSSESHISPVDRYGQLHVEGNKIVGKDGNPVQLRGMSLFWSQWMGKYYNAETVEWLKNDWHCTILRAAMAVDYGGYLERPEAEKKKVKAVVDAAIDQGLYVIIDWHDHEAEKHREAAAGFFAEMAKEYGKYPNVIYETFNEPLNVSWSKVIKPYHEVVLDSIRKYDPDNLVICGTRTWSQRVDEAADDPIADKNVAYTLHFYASTHKESLRNIARDALEKGIALMVTEYGVTEASGDGFINRKESQKWWDFMDEHKISWANWAIDDKDENSAALKPGANATGHWSADEITESGNLIRSQLRKQNTIYNQ